MPNSAVELDEVTKTFRQQVAVDNLSLRVPQGAIYGFIGPNGSGKTTTLRMILRIFQPDQGVVTVLGSRQGRVADDRVGYLPEERGLYKRMKVQDLLVYYAKLKNVTDYRERIRHWLEKLGSAAWAHKKIEALSKGMAQKIQFIAAVVARPQLLILDEPFSGLDPVNMETLRDAVLDLRAEGTTVVFSTHDMDMAERLCDTIFMIFNGRKVLDGSLHEIQAAYPADRVRVRLQDPDASLPPHPNIAHVERNGRHFDFQMVNGLDAHRLLRDLAERTQLEYFDVRRPSLHDIFVRIAGPAGKHAAALKPELPVA
jgi:ABC-2 type transport system ATP-binding protein